MKVAEPFHLHGQMSDSFRAAVFIILSGGFQDAYTYCCRDKVFANAQTGNIVFLSTALFQKDWPNVVKYLIPVVSFLIGTAAAELIHIRFKTYEKIHWRQIILFCEIVFLLVVGCRHTLNRLRTRWARLYVPCRCRRSTRCAATRMRARCASATCAPAPRHCARISERGIKRFCRNR